MISFIKVPKLDGKVGYPSFSHKSHRWTPCVHTLHINVCPSHILHPSSILLLLCSANTPQNNTNMASSLCFFFWFNSLVFAFVSFSWLYCCSVPVTTCTRLGLGYFYRLLWLHNNTALMLPKWAHWRLKWVPGVLRWPPSTMDGGRHFCLQCDDLRAFHFTHYY